MKSPCHFLFNNLGLPTPWILIYNDSILQFYLQSDLVLAANILSLYSLWSDPMENTSIAQQRISYCCHARLSRKVFTTCYIATRTAQIHREHCCYCCVFVWMCLLGHCLVMDVLLLRANCVNVFTNPLPNNGHIRHSIVLVITEYLDFVYRLIFW
jgi:hypothetical protein